MRRPAPAPPRRRNAGTVARFAAAILLLAPSPARADSFTLAQQPPAPPDAGHYARAAFTAQGETRDANSGATRGFKISGSIWRPQPAGSGPKTALIEIAPEPQTTTGDIYEIARKRGATLVFIAPDAAGSRDAQRDALRALALRLRKAEGSAFVIGRGDGDAAIADFARAELNTSENGARFFDALLLHNPPPPAPPDKTPRNAPLIIETLDSRVFWGAARRPAQQETRADNRRLFYLAGVAAPATAADNCAAPINPRRAEPAHRALLAALFDWVQKGVVPPASRPPLLTPARDIAFPGTPGAPSPPAGERLVPATDADGNETSGLLLPDAALPIGTFTARNAARDIKGPACAGGAFIAFAATKAQREATRDPRLSLTERYGSRAYFVATLRVIADKLVKDRLLLPEDADAFVAAAKTAPF